MLNRPISLIPVSLREAALDSPTFRGTVVHYAEQIELVERWLEEYVRATIKLSSGIAGLESLITNYVTAGNPVGISESIMDHDYTLLALTHYADGSKGFWGAVMAGAQKMEMGVVEPLLTFQKKDLKIFKETRRSLETTQARYDTLLARYSAQNKSKEPSSLREDAFQVYETRKLYIRTCLDFCVAATAFRAALDRVLVKVFSDQSREQIRIRREGTADVERYASEIDRIRAWSEGIESSEQSFRKELVNARKELEDKAKRDWQPARDLEEYAVSTVPYLTSRPNVPEEKEGENVPSVKQGYLFMRTLTGKPTRTLWLRRWFFVKDGIFGWLVQGYKGGAMEESEKIGVLLCNIKPAFQEERRFCFEVKTKDTTVLLQAETQAELTQWLAVFEQAKRTAVESATSMSSTQAFSIIPPSAPIPLAEPAYITKGHDGSTASSAMSSNIGKDGPLGALHLPRHLYVHRSSDDDLHLNHAMTMPISATTGTTRSTSIDISSTDNSTAAPSGTREKIAQKLDIGRKPTGNERSLSPSPNPTTGGQSVAGAGISALISASHNALPFHPSGDPTRFGDTTTTLAPTTLVNTPAPVMLSKAAAVTSGPPVDKIPSPDPKGHRKTQSLDIDTGMGIRGTHGTSAPPPVERSYPPMYPPELLAQDTHFRTLFPMRNKGEIVLLVFRATWMPNATQELPGRCYVTTEHIYFYSHYLGLVFTSVIALTHITEVTAAPGRECDHVFLHLHPDPDDKESLLEDDGKEERVMVKVYLESVRLIQRRLVFLVKCRHEDVEKGVKREVAEVLAGLVKLEREEEKGADTESWEDLGERADSPSEATKRGVDGRGRLDSSGNWALQKRCQWTLKEVTRFKLPAVPVVYTPERMNKAFEREFEISPKALFHIMFGDKSMVFQMLYFERRAQYIQQGPWRSLEGGNLRREFGYEIEYYGFFGKQKKSKVMDYQTIDLQDDHLCYVITDRKTPWHLPHRDRFMLVTKVVITHVAKSKCRLSIWTVVEWSNVPKFSKGIIQRQALDDLNLDALDLGDVAAEQVRKLGAASEGRTKSAVRLFGEIGQKTEGPFVPAGGVGILASELDPRAPRLPIKQRRLSRMVAETVLSFSESAASNAIMWTVAGMSKMWEVVSAQRIIMLVLVVSLVWNVVVGKRTAVSWWSERRAAEWLDEVGVKPNGIMSRAVYLRDLEDVGNGTVDWNIEGSQCYAKFRTLASSTDMDASAATASLGFASPSTRATARRLRLGRQHLGSYRHDLLVAMRVVNSLERELVKAEWSNWVHEEMVRCAQARSLLNGAEDEEEMSWLMEYCESCEKEPREGLA